MLFIFWRAHAFFLLVSQGQVPTGGSLRPRSVAHGADSFPLARIGADGTSATQSSRSSTAFGPRLAV
jgi:hypothetical protein